VHALSTSRRGALSLPGRIRELRAIVARYPGCIFHLHNTGSDGGTIPLIAAKSAGASYLMRTEHQPPEYPVSLRRRAMIRLRDRWLLVRIVCVSRANMEQHVRDLGRDRRKFDCVPNCVDIEAFSPDAADGAIIRQLAGVADGELLVGMLGRLAEPRKGAEYFVDMARTLSQRLSHLRFVIVGDGPRRPQLEQRAQGDVTFLGRQPDGQACYAAMDIAVMSSLWEGGPITVLEAMAMGRPLVATDVGMVREVIDDGVNGRIVPPGDTAALVSAVSALAADAELRSRMSACARQTIVDRFSAGVMVEAMLEVYAAAS
jgi:glycosyltransferase involved in cell wall biosynthesis